MSQAVLFLVFNRPDTARVVFEAIRAAKPPKLYLASDGPRASRDGELAAVQESRALVAEVDWDCEVYTLFRDENLGCRRAVSGALDWFFSQEESGIVLEDDCVPSPSFFLYADELLRRFADDERVMSIAALHAHGDAHQSPASYFFSRYNHCWGWASWRRAWQLYDHDMSQWPALRDTDWLVGVGNGNRLFARYWTSIFDRAHAGLIDSWAYRWTFSCWAQHGLTILPARNLVKNIGFTVEATHTTDANSPLALLELQSLNFPLVHPIGMVQNMAADSWSDRRLFGITGAQAVKDQIRALPGGHMLAAACRRLKYKGRNV